MQPAKARPMTMQRAGEQEAGFNSFTLWRFTLTVPKTQDPQFGWWILDFTHTHTFWLVVKDREFPVQGLNCSRQMLLPGKEGKWWISKPPLGLSPEIIPSAISPAIIHSAISPTAIHSTFFLSSCLVCQHCAGLPGVINQLASLRVNKIERPLFATSSPRPWGDQKRPGVRCLGKCIIAIQRTQSCRADQICLIISSQFLSRCN